MAWGFNGYVYHTARDDVDQLGTGFMQHGGDNVLPTTLAYAYTPSIDALVDADKDYELGVVVMDRSKLLTGRSVL